MDARRQYPAYLDYAVKHGIIEQGSDVGSAPFLFFWIARLIKKTKTYKESKKNTDACVDQLRRMTGSEPIAVAGCEELVRSVLAGKDGTL